MGGCEKRNGGDSYEAGKGELGHEQVGVVLVAADFFEGEGAGAVAALFGLRDGIACFWGG